MILDIINESALAILFLAGAYLYSKTNPPPKHKKW